MKNKGIIITMGIIIVVLIGIIIFLLIGKDTQQGKDLESDAIKFAKEYTLIEKDNVFKYASIDKIINTLETGTGVVYLGFPECQWCQQYVVYLNEIAKDRKISQIYYYNIKEDREENSKNYQKITKLLKDYLPEDEDGNPKVYVPAVIFMNKGTVLGFDDETSHDTKGFDNPSEYWTKSEIEDLKDRLNSYIDKANMCFDCNS